MAGQDYTTDKMIERLKLRVSLPTSQSLFTPADLVSLMDIVMREELIPEIQAVREEYFVTHTDVALVTDQSDYDIPTRAIGNALRDIVLVDSAGNEMDIPRLEPEDIKSNTTLHFRRLYGIYLKGHQVIFYPDVNSSNGFSIRFKFERRPNQLIQKSKAAQITAIASNVITVTNVPSDWTTSLNYDIIGEFSPFSPIADDQAITLIDGFDITLASAPTDLAVGQWIAPAGQTPVPQLPYEAQFFIEQKAGARALQALKDRSGIAAAEKTAEILLNKFKLQISPRQKGSVKKVKNHKGIMNYTGGATGRRVI